MCCRRPLQALACCLFIVALTSRADLITWTNTSGGSWNSAANWSPNQVPADTDVAAITSPGTYVLTLNANPTIAGLIVGGDSGTQTIATAGKILTLNGTGAVGTNGCFLLSGGSLSGINHVVLAGVLNWQSGSIDTNAAVTVTAGGRVTLSSPGNRTKSLDGCLTNGGTVTWQPHGPFAVGGTLHNLAGGLFEAQEDNVPITKAGDQAIVVNDGVFRKSANPGAIACRVPLIIRGTVETLGGTLALEEGGVFHSGCAFTGAGTTSLNSGTNVLDGDLTSANLVLNGATLLGTATLHGKVTWSRGTIGSGAAITVAPDSELSIRSGGNYVKYVVGSLTNAGMIAWQPYGSLSIGGTVHNLAGAVFDVQLNDRFITASSAGAIFRNEGMFLKSTGDSFVGCEVLMVNHGAMEIAAGTMAFSGGFENPGGSIALAGGTLQATPALELAGGRLTGWGALLADVTNHAAVVSVASTNGGLTVNGDYTQRLAGILELTIGGTYPGTNQSYLRITGKAQLGGAIDVQLSPGYLPEPATEFAIMSFRSCAGDFVARNGFYLLGHDRRLATHYRPKDLTLSVGAAPDPVVVTLGVAAEGETALIWWPSEYSGGSLYVKPNLNEPTWTLLPGVLGRIVVSPMPPESYYGLAMP